MKENTGCCPAKEEKEEKSKPRGNFVKQEEGSIGQPS
jgi:hypothetical protein